MSLVLQRWAAARFNYTTLWLWVPAPVRNCAPGRDDDCGCRPRHTFGVVLAKARTHYPKYQLLRDAVAAIPTAMRRVSPQQHCVGAGHGVRALGHRLLQRWRLHGDVLGKEARQCDVA